MDQDKLRSLDIRFVFLCAGLVLLSLSMYHSFKFTVSIPVIVGLLVIFMSFEVSRIITLVRSGGSMNDKNVRSTISFSYMLVMIVGIVLVLFSLMDVMVFKNLALFAVGLGLVLYSLIRK